MKVGDSKIKELANTLVFLEDSVINAPRLIKSGIYEDSYYVLMSECKGQMTYDIEPMLAVKVLARALKEIHSLKPSKDVVVKDVHYFQEEMKKIDKEKLGKEDLEFIDNLHDSFIQDDLVYSHGDYCLPNILYDNGITSIIDLDYAGVNFRYSDILDCIWSLEYNFNTTKYKEPFLKEYGIDEFDEKTAKVVKTIHRIMEIKGY